MRGLHRHRVDAAAAGLQHHFAVDGGLRGLQEGFQVRLQRIVVEAFVHQLDPFARDLGLEAVLLFGQHGLFQRAVRGQQRHQTRRFEHDAPLQADHGVARVHAAAHAIGREQRVQFRQQRGAGDGLSVQADRLAVPEADRHPQRFHRPLGARRAPATGALARSRPGVDLAAGHGQAQQVLVDGVALLLGAHAEATLFQVGLFVGTGLRVFLLDLADRRHDAVVATGLHRKIETHLVVAHAGATVRDGIGAQLGGPLQRGVDDQVAVGHQQRVLALVTLARPHERLDEALPDRRATIDGDVAGHAQLGGALLDEGAFFGIHAAGIGEHGMDVPAAFLQVGHAEAGVEAAGEGEDDVFGLVHGGGFCSGIGGVTAASARS